MAAQKRPTEFDKLLARLGEEFMDALMDSRELQHRRHGDVPVRFHLEYGGLRVGELTIRLSRLADVVCRHYRVSRVEAGSRVLSIFRNIARNAGGWIERLAADQDLARRMEQQPDFLLTLLDQPRGSELLQYDSVQRYLTLQADTPDLVDAVARKFARGLRARPWFKGRRRGRPRKISDRQLFRLAWFDAQEALKPFHQALQRDHRNPSERRRALCAKFPEISTRLERAELLEAVLTAAVSLEDLTSQLLGAEHGVTASTARAIARARPRRQKNQSGISRPVKKSKTN